jgi:GNAT superfamily N-acetyltransferase
MLFIRKAVPDDAEKIISFQLAMAMETEDMTLDTIIVKKGVNAVFSSPGKGMYYVAEDKGEIVASLLITYEWSDWRNTDVWWFQSVYVIPSYRRKGIFRMMYAHIKQEAAGKDIAGLRLYVESNNVPARKTYEAMGMSSQHYTMYEWLW